jgi:hypothetical protein
MAVLMVKILDRNKNIQTIAQTDQTHQYPALSSGGIHNIESQALIERWVDVIKNKAQR